MFDRGLFLLSLLVAIGGLLVIDRRFTLAFFKDPKRTWRTLLASEVLFIAWDIAGITLQIFKEGTSKYLLGIDLVPELYVEEVFFLFLLCYSALLIWRLAETRWPRT